MLHRFTERARRVVFQAPIEVARCGSASLEPEHLLLGAAARGRRARLPRDRTVDSVEQLRREVASRRPSGEPAPLAEVVPFSPAAMRVLHAAEQEADTQTQKAIGTEHLLPGLGAGSCGQTRKDDACSRRMHSRLIVDRRSLGIGSPH